MTPLETLVEETVNKLCYTDHELGTSHVERVNPYLTRDEIQTLITTTAQRVVREITHEWNKGELRLDGTAQGAVNCIEHFRNYLPTLNK